jgi:pimeloyl-ACP methyl ester carboxylesterase
MTMGVDGGELRVLAVPGGASSVHGYFPRLGRSVGARAELIEVDPPWIGVEGDRRPLRLSEYAGELALAARSRGDGRLVVVGHSLGGLIALRLAVDEPGLVAGLLLLDPTPPAPRSSLTALSWQMRAGAAMGPAGRGLWDAGARRALRGIETDGEQERALRVYTHPRFVTESVRWARHLAGDGTLLAGDLAAGRLPHVPAVVVSAGEYGQKSAVRRRHEQLARWIPGAELQVWDGTRHPLHIQRPDRVTSAVLALLERAADPLATGHS